MKTNIKMRVTPEQLEKICNTISKGWLYFKSANYMYIFNDGSIEVSYSKENWSKYNLQEIDADLFIRTNGTCEEDKYTMIDTIIHKPYNVAILEQKLQKKNEILKKARIKRKNQREELHKLNLKLQKCISFEEHNQIMQKYKLDSFISESKLLSTESHNERLNEATRNINDSLGKPIDIKDNQDKEIEKLKAVIEYLESKVK